MLFKSLGASHTWSPSIWRDKSNCPFSSQHCPCSLLALSKCSVCAQGIMDSVSKSVFGLSYGIRISIRGLRHGIESPQVALSWYPTGKALGPSTVNISCLLSSYVNCPYVPYMYINHSQRFKLVTTVDLFVSFRIFDSLITMFLRAFNIGIPPEK